MRATITLDDVEGGGFEAAVCYEGGFTPSASHIVAHKLMQHLNTLADPQGEERIFGGAPSAREAIQAERPEDAIPSGIQIEVTNDQAE